MNIPLLTYAYNMCKVLYIQNIQYYIVKRNISFLNIITENLQNKKLTERESARMKGKLILSKLVVYPNMMYMCVYPVHMHPYWKLQQYIDVLN